LDAETLAAELAYSLLVHGGLRYPATGMWESPDAVLSSAES
jgi:hypothetical protein